MRNGLPQVIGAGAVLLILIVAFVIVPVLSAGETRGSFSAYEPSWQGTQEARDLLAGEPDISARNVGTSPLVLRDVDPSNTFLIIAGVERPYSDAEARALDDFMDEGGSILLLDDYGYGDAFAHRHGISYLKRPLLDDAFERNQSFVRVLARPTDDTVYQVLLNDPSALQDLDANRTDLEAIIISGSQSFLDLNNNEVIDVVDKEGPFNVGIRRDVGGQGGSLIVISDSGFLNNDMLPRQENREFLVDLVHSALPEGGLVLFDESRRQTAGLEVPVYAAEKSMLALFRSIPATGMIFTAGFLTLAVVAIVRLPGREPWIHRFLPGAYCPPGDRQDESTLLQTVIEARLEMEGGATKDRMLRDALDSEGKLDKQDIHLLIKHLAELMAIEMPADSAPEPDPVEAPASPKKVPVPS